MSGVREALAMGAGMGLSVSVTVWALTSARDFVAGLLARRIADKLLAERRKRYGRSVNP